MNKQSMSTIQFWLSFILLIALIPSLSWLSSIHGTTHAMSGSNQHGRRLIGAGCMRNLGDVYSSTVLYTVRIIQ
jgi:hypothetical protein